MQYHADAITKQNKAGGETWTVELLGYEGETTANSTARSRRGKGAHRERASEREG
jgi:hypothetical protein